MPSLKSIRTRIRSVKNTQQITRAMKMVSAAKLRRAQEAILAARPYAERMDRVLQGVAVRADLAAHPLLTRRKVKRLELVVLASDRGLCGGFNANIARRAQRFILDNEEKVTSITLRTVGRKANDFFRRRAVKVRKDHPGLLGNLKFTAAEGLARELSALYLPQAPEGGGEPVPP